MICDACNKEIKNADSDAVLKDNQKLHKGCYIKVTSSIKVKPGADLKVYKEKATSEKKEDVLKENTIGSIDDEYMKRASEYKQSEEDVKNDSGDVSEDVE